MKIKVTHYSQKSISFFFKCEKEEFNKFHKLAVSPRFFYTIVKSSWIGMENNTYYCLFKEERRASIHASDPDYRYEATAFKKEELIELLGKDFENIFMRWLKIVWPEDQIEFAEGMNKKFNP